MKKWTILSIFVVLVMMLASISQAHDDGPLFGRNLSRTPNRPTAASQMSVMSLYVPAQSTQELLLEAIAYTLEDGTPVEEMTEAKPLIATYNDGMIDVIPEIDGVAQTGAGFGERDAFAALSLDDGATWKNYNLSDSALRSSFVLQNGEAYPGDVFKLVHQVEGNRVAAAWISRYCASGAPLYSWLDDDKDALLVAYPELDHLVTVEGAAEPYQLYLDDLFGVAGSQKSVDYTLQGFPEVGEVPYGCVWTARGTLELDSTTGMYDIVWRASERLTSGRRDPHQISITSSPGAGFIISWQEDPEGLRPGKGMGPGEGWSGAIANSKTDIWYTYIDLAHFDDVVINDEIVDPELDDAPDWFALTEKPKIAVPFAVPVRLTDNNQCKPDMNEGSQGYQPYCYADFDGVDEAADLCASEATFTNGSDDPVTVCVTADGRALTGRTANTRVRWAMKSYDSDADGAPDSAWVLLGTEKMKALGTTLDSDGEVFDIGKNMWYHTFEFDKPELVAQGLMLNAPALDPSTGLVLNGAPVIDEFGNELYDTEIARRFNLFVNSPTAMQAIESGTAGILIYKQGILFQGGPADIFIRRIVLPDDFDAATMNPFAYDNVQCVQYADDGTATEVERKYADGSNPNYLEGLCEFSGMNMSGTTIVECDGDSSSADTCAEQFPFSMTYEEWASDEEDTQLPKVTRWIQAPDNFNDESWANPFDVSKGHRGFIDGEFIMLMYATAPNWKAGTTGNEAYNLYIRRSFDGGQTWTTLPADYVHWDDTTLADMGAVADGTESCEDYGWGGQTEEEVCTTYAAGVFEQARNVSRLTGSKVTTLDPRYSPSGGMLKLDYKSLLCDDDVDGVWENCGYVEDADAPWDQEVRNPSVFFATYETGDNTVVTVETGASPLDMFYAKAFNFGDEWDDQDACSSDETQVDWYPSASCTDGAADVRWDWLENGADWATEASVYGNPSGSKFYAVWNQELAVDVEHDIYTDMDSQFRRIYYNLTDVQLDPVAEILYVSTDRVELSTWPEDEVITLIGTGRDLDRIGDLEPSDDGIINQGWWHDTKEESHFYEGRTMQAPPNGWIPGKHDFSFEVEDNDLHPDPQTGEMVGNKTRSKTVTIWVVEEFHDVFLPMAIR